MALERHVIQIRKKFLAKNSHFSILGGQISKIVQSLNFKPYNMGLVRKLLGPLKREK